MAKSVSVFFAVLFSLHAAHRVSALNFDAIVDFAAVSKVHEPWYANPAEVQHKANDVAEYAEKIAESRRSKPALPAGFSYVKVTGIKVGQGSMMDINPAKGVILSTTTPFLILDSEAYELLEKKLPAGDPVSQIDASWHQLCYAGGKAVPITLVLDVNGDKTEMKKFWYKQSDGSMCLGILPSS